MDVNMDVVELRELVKNGRTLVKTPRVSDSAPMACSALPRVGDEGQRYEIRCEMDGEDSIIGWANDPKAYAESVRLHPCWSNHRAIDRQEPNSLLD